MITGREVNAVLALMAEEKKNLQVIEDKDSEGDGKGS